MTNRLIYAFIFIGVFACSKPTEEVVEKRKNFFSKPKEFVKPDLNNDLVERIMDIEIGSSRFDAEVLEPFFWGHFHRGRFSCYFIDDVDFPYHGTEISNITLTYIDNVLIRKKFELKGELSNVLKLKHTSIRFRPLSDEALDYVRSGADLVDPFDKLLVPGGYEVILDQDEVVVTYEKNIWRNLHTYEIEHKLFFNYMKMVQGDKIRTL